MANWLDLKKLQDWDYLVLLGFQYDSISDEQIASALADTGNLHKVDTKKDWEDDDFLMRAQHIPEEDKHAYRVAAIVHELRNGGKMSKAIELSTFAVGRCCSCVPNGHHRIRALQFMGMDCSPFSLDGFVEPLENLVATAGTTCPEEFKLFFEQRLLLPDEEDIQGSRRKPKKGRTA